MNSSQQQNLSAIAMLNANPALFQHNYDANVRYYPKPRFGVNPGCVGK